MIDFEVIEICGQPFRVEYRELTPAESDPEDGEDGTYAKVFVMARLIVVTPSTPPANRAEVVAHEVSHAVYALAGLTELLGKKLEEAVCTANELVWLAMQTKRREKKKTGPTPGGPALKANPESTSGQ